MIDPANWSKYLSDFSERNRGRRARFELFRRDGEIAEEEQEGSFDSISLDDEAVVIVRIDKSKRSETEMRDRIPNVHGISVQLDADGSDNTLEFTNERGDLTILHFESTVDGDS
jgi:hypothetical protein